MKIELWMEGYAVTGETAKASMIYECDANSFDEAIVKHNAEYPQHMIKKYERSQFESDEAYEGYKDKYHLWLCGIFDNELDARKSFG